MEQRAVATTSGGWRPTGAALVLLAAAVRGAMAAGEVLIPNDSLPLLTTARAVAGGDLAAAFHGLIHPLPPLLIGLFGGSELAAVLLSIAAGGLGALAVFRIAEGLAGRGAGVVAGLFYAVLPALARLGGAPLAEGLSVPLSLFAVERAIREPPSRRKALAAGALAGLAYLCRPEGLLLPLVLVPALLLKRHARLALLLSLGFAAVGGPYAAYLSASSGTLALTRKKPVGRFFRTEEGFAAKMKVKQEQLGIRRPSAPEAAAEALRTYVQAGAWVLPALAAAGLVVLFGRGRRGSPLTLLALVAVTVVVGFRLLWLHGYLERRHFAVPVALTIPLAAVGLLAVARRFAPVVAGLAAAALLVPAVWPRTDAKATIRDAGMRIHAEAGPGKVVATYVTPRIAYYAEGRDFPLHLKGHGAEMARALRDFADYLALLPGRMDSARYQEYRAAAGRDPDYAVGSGEWAVEIWRLR